MFPNIYFYFHSYAVGFASQCLRISGFQYFSPLYSGKRKVCAPQNGWISFYVYINGTAKEHIKSLAESIFRRPFRFALKSFPLCSVIDCFRRKVLSEQSVWFQPRHATKDEIGHIYRQLIFLNYSSTNSQQVLDFFPCPCLFLVLVPKLYHPNNTSSHIEAFVLQYRYVHCTTPLICHHSHPCNILKSCLIWVSIKRISADTSLLFCFHVIENIIKKNLVRKVNYFFDDEVFKYSR